MNIILSLLYTMDNFPKEIVKHIFEFYYVKCQECNKIIEFDKIQKNVTTIYYRAIFEDDYPFPRIYKHFDYICLQCVEDLKEEYIKPLNLF